MFKSLKDKLKKSVSKLTQRVEEPIKREVQEEIQEEIEKPIEESVKDVQEIELIKEPEIKEEKTEPKKETKLKEESKKIIEEIEKPKAELKEKPKLGFREKFRTRVFSDNDIDEFFVETESELLQANVALEVIDFLREELKKQLVNTAIKRGEAEEKIKEAFETSLFNAVNHGDVDLEDKLKEKKPLACVFLGFNGSGKTTTIAKIAKYLQDREYKSVLAAGDTFRAASIEQLEHHGKKLDIKVIKHQYGADAAAVVFDAKKFAESNKYDFVLADTAGRAHTDKNLMDELEKICRVNKPDLKILIVDSLTGNDAVEQAKKYDEKVGVDAVVMTKIDVNEKGGSLLSVCYAIKKPIMFLGTGQGYDDLKKFDAKEFVKELME